MARILLVDDDLGLAKVSKDWLTFQEHAVDVVHNGQEGWALLTSQEYDMVILDWDLPDIDGIDLLKRFRATGGTTPVLMLTGRDSVDSKEVGLDAGADDYLTKPFHMKELSARIRALVRRSDSRQTQIKPLGTNNEAVLKEANLAGTSLAARYEFLEVLGKGGIGIVFKAHHPHLNKLLAIKMLQSSELNEESVARFKIEAQAASLLEHPNIATIHDFGLTENQQPFMVMEFIDGLALDQVIQQEDHLAVEQSLDIFVQVCAAMAHAHEKGVLHRDIKPGNIMLRTIPDRPPLPKLLDFGCAKLRDLKSQKAAALTQVGQVLGSPPYMSPEQVKGKALDERSDIYSLGCVVYETVTGYVPYQGESSAEIMYKHVDEELIPLRDMSPELPIPVELEPIVAKALEKEPAKRYQSMQAFKEELVSLRSTVRNG